MSDNPSVDENAVREIINSKSVTTFFQPLISVITKSIIGFEAFSRGGSDACVLDPSIIFHKDLPAEIKVKMDRLCREKALEQFAHIHENHKGMLLYINLNPDILPHVDAGSNVLHEQVNAAGIQPSNIVIECSLNTTHQKEASLFMNKYRELGYKFSMDDCSVDSPFSSALVGGRPDFVKIDRSFFGDEERKEYSGQALETMFAVSNLVGATVVGQRVETESESIRLMASGIQLQQGYYYTKDESGKSEDPAKMFFQKIVNTGEKFKKVRREVIRMRKERLTSAFRVVDSVCAKLSNVSEMMFEETLVSVMSKGDGVISLLVLDNKGLQLTPRHHMKSASATTSSEAILGTRKGVDHSMHDYVIYLDMGNQKYVSPPFISPYSKEKACIITKPFFNVEGSRYVVWVEVPYPQ